MKFEKLNFLIFNFKITSNMHETYSYIETRFFKQLRHIALTPKQDLSIERHQALEKSLIRRF